MKILKIYIIIIPFLIIFFLLTLPNESESSDILEENNKENIYDENKIVSVSYNSSISQMSLEDYLVGVLACEMPASFNKEALKAGAVAARTFYYYMELSLVDYIAVSSDQCYISIDEMQDKWGEKFQKYYNFLKDAVKETNDEVLYYEENIIKSFYFSLSNGKTENSSSVFGVELPYLVTVDSIWDKNINNFEVKVTMSLEEFINKLEIVNTQNIEIKNIIRDSSNRVDKLQINDNYYTGVEVRKLLGLRSTDFDIIISNNTVTLVTRGYGHGVGMSQYGANEMAKMGYTYEEILKYYYTGVELKKYCV